MDGLGTDSDCRPEAGKLNLGSKVARRMVKNCQSEMQQACDIVCKLLARKNSWMLAGKICNLFHKNCKIKQIR